MKLLIISAAVLASAVPNTLALSQPFRLACVGEGTSESYPFGIQKTGKIKYRVEGEGKQIAIFQQGLKDENICPTGAACTFDTTNDLVQVQVSNTPNNPPYSTRFQLDRKRLTFKASGGGLDGGWTITGTCEPERP